jgi:hypothetical protein
VLLDHAGEIFEGHGPATELGELRTESDVAVMER